MWFILLGILLAVISSVCSSYATVIQKMSHNSADELSELRAKCERNGISVDPEIEKDAKRVHFIRWILVLLMYAGNVQFRFVALALVPLSIIAPCSAVTIALNAILARIYFGEHQTRLGAISTCMILAGCAVAMIVGQKETDDYEVDELIDMYSVPFFYIYTIIQCTIFVFAVAYTVWKVLKANGPIPDSVLEELHAEHLKQNKEKVAVVKTPLEEDIDAKLALPTASSANSNSTTIELTSLGLTPPAAVEEQETSKATFFDVNNSQRLRSGSVLHRDLSCAVVDVDPIPQSQSFLYTLVKSLSMSHPSSTMEQEHGRTRFKNAEIVAMVKNVSNNVTDEMGTGGYSPGMSPLPEEGYDVYNAHDGRRVSPRGSTADKYVVDKNVPHTGSLPSAVSFVTISNSHSVLHRVHTQDDIAAVNANTGTPQDPVPADVIFMSRRLRIQTMLSPLEAGILVVSVSYMGAFMASWMNLTAKSFMAALKGSMEGNNQFDNGLLYLIMIVLVVSLLLTLKLLSFLMSLFDAVTAVPIYQSMLIIGLIFVGIFYFDEFADVETVNLIVFCCAIGICLVGIVVLSQEKGVKKPAAPIPEVDDHEVSNDGELAVVMEKSNEIVPSPSSKQLASSSDPSVVNATTNMV